MTTRKGAKVCICVCISIKKKSDLLTALIFYLALPSGTYPALACVPYVHMSAFTVTSAGEMMY